MCTKINAKIGDAHECAGSTLTRLKIRLKTAVIKSWRGESNLLDTNWSQMKALNVV